MKPLYIWNNTNFKADLSNLYGEKNVLSNPEIFRLKKEDLNRYSALIILCEFNGVTQSEKLQEMQGIDLAKKFRRNGINVPIIFTSFLSRNQVYANKLERGIINTIGHSFIQLPCTLQQLQEESSKIQSLNELEMYDIVHNYCSLGGIIKMLLHSLNGLQSALNNDSNNAESIKEKIRNAIVQAYQVFNKSANPVLVEFDSRFKDLTSTNLNEAIRFVENMGIELTELYATDGEISSELKAKGIWKLLLLDDEITEEHLLINKLKERDVQVICSRDAQEAESIVENETSLSLIISDYRLENEVNGLKIHQSIQGYQFLKQISDGRPGYLRLAALSSLPRKFLMESFKHYGLRVGIYSKKDYLENEATIHLLCDEWVEIGNENAEAITRTPRITSDNWVYFEPFYWYHRNSVNYSANENYINQKAKEYCEGVKENKFPFLLTGYTSLNLEGSKAKPSNEKYFQIYQQKCICRRVAIWYTQYNKAWQLRDVHKIIKGNEYTGEEKETTAKNQINSNLALSLNEYPWNMTIEEKHWLMYQMNISEIDKIEKQETAVLKLVSQNLKEWLIENNLTEDILTNKEFENFVINSKERYGANFKMFKSFLYRLYAFIIGKDELIQDLQKLIINWQSQTNQIKYSANTLKFESYLEYIRKRLMLTKSIKKDAKVKISTQEEYYKDIVKEALSAIPSHERNEFPTSALMFYHSLGTDSDSLKTKHDWVKALLEFHAHQIAEFLGHDVSYDDVKVYRKQKKSNPADFDS